MPIPSHNADAALLLLELNTQCILFARALDSLKTASHHWINLCDGVDDGEQFPPIKIISQCTICLSSLTVIRKFLFDCGRRKPAILRRCASLRNLLGEPSLPHIASSEVRNSWEHLDERMDALLPSVRDYSISQIYINTKNPGSSELALKRFDPNDLSIWFLDKRIPLLECEPEVQLVLERVKLGFIRLQIERHDIY